MQRATTSRADLPENIQYGRVPVALRMGLYLPESDVRTATVTQNIINGAETNSREADYFNIFRYILAALVALAAIIIALRSFGGTLAQSVISIGRNPLARKTIISMMLWNSFLIVVVSGVGLGLAIAILLL
jgi:F0F1-type ATP synthase membrane subunit c/vacuolar-type H+-ATPase subunit K